MRTSLATLFLLFATPLVAQPLVACDEAAKGLLKVWPELREVGGVKTGAALLKDSKASWEVPVFAFWRAAEEKKRGNDDLIWNTVIIYSDSLVQCAYGSLPAGQKPPAVRNLDYYEANRAKVLTMVTM
jgi:hypothetical protein